MKGMEKIKIFPREVMKKLSIQFIGKFRHRVIDKGHDAHGKPLPPYSKTYKDMLADWNVGKNIPAEYKEISLTTGGDKISKRPFILRGKGITVSGLRHRESDNDSFKVGWRGVDASVVEENAARGRDIFSDIPDDEKTWMANFLANNVEKQYKQKVKNMKITVSI